MQASQPDSSRNNYALGLVDGSYDWYRNAAIKSRRYHRLSAVALQVTAAGIPVSAAISPGSAVVPAVLGAVVVVLSGLRSLFDWQENYIRFSGAREAVEAHRRLYMTGAAPYDDTATRDAALVANLTTIERDEMAGWLKAVSKIPVQGRPANSIES